MKFKFGTKQIVLSVVAVLLIAVMIAGNIILNMYSPFFHAALGGTSEPEGNRGGAHDGESAFEYASRISEEAAEDSIVLLKNDNGDGTPYLPLPETTTFSIFGWGATDQGFLLSGGGSGGTNTNRDSEDVTRRKSAITQTLSTPIALSAPLTPTIVRAAAARRVRPTPTGRRRTPVRTSIPKTIPSSTPQRTLPPMPSSSSAAGAMKTAALTNSRTSDPIRAAAIFSSPTTKN